MIWVVHPGSGSRNFYPSRILGSKRHQIPDPGSGSATLKINMSCDVFSWVHGWQCWVQPSPHTQNISCNISCAPFLRLCKQNIKELLTFSNRLHSCLYGKLSEMRWFKDFILVDQPAAWYLLDPAERPPQDTKRCYPGKRFFARTVYNICNLSVLNVFRVVEASLYTSRELRQGYVGRPLPPYRLYRILEISTRWLINLSFLLRVLN